VDDHDGEARSRPEVSEQVGGCGQSSSRGTDPHDGKRHAILGGSGVDALQIAWLGRDHEGNDTVGATPDTLHPIVASKHR